jgi:hypothetical protein
MNLLRCPRNPYNRDFLPYFANLFARRDPCNRQSGAENASLSLK